MRADFDAHRDVWGPVLLTQLRTWAATVFQPAPVWQALGVFQPEKAGSAFEPTTFVGGGPNIIQRGPRVSFLPETPAGYERLRAFDVIAADYRAAVQDYSRHIFAKLLLELGPSLVPDARLLDVACGPGTEVVQLASVVPDGEVIGCDLSKEMIAQASRLVAEAKLDNVGLHQLDAHELPSDWTGAFDAVLCSLSFQFFLDGDRCGREFHRVLAPGGRLLIADPGPAWFTAIAAPLTKAALPAFVRYRSGAEFCELLLRAGFRQAYSVEVLPGIGVVSATP